jgi:hypothetical protein
MPSYVLEERAASEDASDRADGQFQQALNNNQHCDKDTLTVLFAAVLFCSALSSRTRPYRSQVAFSTSRSCWAWWVWRCSPVSPS